jgi:hypothetical protein
MISPIQGVLGEPIRKSCERHSRCVNRTALYSLAPSNVPGVVGFELE